ncbi:MAG: hypothetical protein JNM63_14525, partial [Spirochaetia bacterium]|nr:hypothetical protein [Spirochaetia bacterium]
MKIHLKFFFGFFAVAGLGFYYFSYKVTSDVKKNYREAMEEPLVDMANVLAEDAARYHSKEGFRFPGTLYGGSKPAHRELAA